MENDHRQKLERLVVEIFDDRLYSFLLGKARRRVPSYEVEDVVQSAVKRLLEKIKKGRLDWVLDESNPAETLRRLFFTTHLNDAISKIWKESKCWRHQHEKANETEWAKIEYLYNRYLLNPPQGIEDIKDPDEFWDERLRLWVDLTHAVGQLPETQKRVIYLYYVKKWSLKKIAAFLRISVKAVKQRLYRARRNLYEILCVD
jgi:RNA polymerase sigma factor (sigma-70 family)